VLLLGLRGIEIYNTDYTFMNVNSRKTTKKQRTLENWDDWLSVAAISRAVVALWNTCP